MHDAASGAWLGGPPSLPSRNYAIVLVTTELLAS